MITISIGRPRVTVGKTTVADGEASLEAAAEPLFCTRNFVILAAGIAVGIILKQQSDIVTLKRTVEYLQEVIR